MTSPSRKNSGGVRANPTPSGVPVAITSPGSSVKPRLRLAMILRNGENHLRRVRMLFLDAVDGQLRSRASADPRCRQASTIHGPIGHVLIERLSFEPLHVRFLQIACRHVVEAGVAEDDVERVAFRDVAAALSDNDRELRFPIVLRRKRRIELERLVRIRDRGRRLGEEGRHVGQLELLSARASAFFGVREIVAADAKDVLVRTSPARASRSSSQRDRVAEDCSLGGALRRPAAR